jgi:hypothetical protein
LIVVAADWASRRSGEHFDRAEARMLQLVADAPEASAPVAKEVRRALVLFYDATVATYGARDVPSVRELTAACHELEHCQKLVDAAVQAGRGRKHQGTED